VQALAACRGVGSSRGLQRRASGAPLPLTHSRVARFRAQPLTARRHHSTASRSDNPSVPANVRSASPARASQALTFAWGKIGHCPAIA
jgi:hypothetical protein